MKKLYLIFFWICIISVGAQAQHQVESGFPGITNFSPKEFDAFRQNWAIAQDENGVMYFGNTDGLLEYDGNSWQVYTVPNKSGILGMALGKDGKLYVGAQAELGYFQTDSFGKLIFTSLLKFLPEDKRDFSNVTETIVLDGKVFFNSEKYLLIWDIEKREFEIIASEIGFHILFKGNETIYAREWGEGLKVWDNGKLVLINGGERFADERVYAVLPFPNDPETILIATRTMGFFKYSNYTLVPFKTEVDQFIRENLIYLPGTVLQDGNILLNTLNGGSILMDIEGREVSRYNQENGILNNTVYFTFQDRAGGIWLATENGISRIDYDSPISYFDARSNITSYAHDVIRYQGQIYSATSNGVYKLDPKSSIFNQLPNFNKQTWDLVEVEGDLLAGTSDGLYKIEDDKFIPIKRTLGNEFIVNELIQSELNPKRIFIAVTSGIWSMVKEGNDWVEEGQLMEVLDQPTSLSEDPEGNLWMGTFSNGLFKISFKKGDDNNPQITEPIVENFDKKNGIQDGIVFAEKINDQIYYVTTDSIYQFNETEKRFLVDTSDQLVGTFYELGAILDRVPIMQDGLGRIWLGNKKKIAIGEIKENGKWEWIILPSSRISDEEIYTLYTEKNGTTWFASGEGFIKYAYGKIAQSNPQFSTIIRSVMTGKDSTIFYGRRVENLQVPELNFKNNELKFRFAATSYEAKNVNQFSTFLEGFDEEWSPWSLETLKSYTNLPPGEYTFRVKSLNLLGLESEVASYSFIILPPWYKTWWAYLIYAIFTSLLVYSIVQIRAFYLKKENRILEEKVQHRTKQLNQSLTNLKSTQAQLIQSEKMASLGELTAGVAHEMQNPLNFVKNFSEVSTELIDEMKEELLAGNQKMALEITDDLKINLEKIMQHGKRADSIVKSMLEHSRSGTGQKESTDLNKLISKFAHLTYRSQQAKNENLEVILDLQLDPNLPMIAVVQSDIGKVILNLVNNAFYAVTEKSKSENNPSAFQPRVVVRSFLVRPEEGPDGNLEKEYIQVSISDNGSGIPDAIKEKIFQPFFTTKPTGSGTGLGLSLSYDIVKAHGGELRVESKEGEGTEFKVLFPL